MARYLDVSKYLPGELVRIRGHVNILQGLLCRVVSIPGEGDPFEGAIIVNPLETREFLRSGPIALDKKQLCKESAW